jgi:glycosyltransferase involved in cell wall biosynthesis
MSCPVSVIVITKNEERNIAACLQSVAWADEIIVVDAESTDRTVELAKGFTPQVIVRPWEGYSAAKTFAVSLSTHEWVLWLDADERVTAELAEDIQHAVEENYSGVSAFRFARRAYFLGKWIRHCGWYPGFVTRLFRKSRAQFSDDAVHEQLAVRGAVAALPHDLLHFTDDDLEHYFEKLNRYTSLAADQLLATKRRITAADLLFRPLFLFLKMYFVKAGFLDGTHGFLLCRLSASYVLAKYGKLWQRQQLRDETMKDDR